MILNINKGYLELDAGQTAVMSIKRLQSLPALDIPENHLSISARTHLMTLSGTEGIVRSESTYHSTVL